MWYKKGLQFNGDDFKEMSFETMEEIADRLHKVLSYSKTYKDSGLGLSLNTEKNLKAAIKKAKESEEYVAVKINLNPLETKDRLFVSFINVKDYTAFIDSEGSIVIPFEKVCKNSRPRVSTLVDDLFWGIYRFTFYMYVDNIKKTIRNGGQNRGKLLGNLEKMYKDNIYKVYHINKYKEEECFDSEVQKYFDEVKLILTLTGEIK